MEVGKNIESVTTDRK